MMVLMAILSQKDKSDPVCRFCEHQVFCEPGSLEGPATTTTTGDGSHLQKYGDDLGVVYGIVFITF